MLPNTLFSTNLLLHMFLQERVRGRGREGGGRREIEEKVFNITIIMKDET
jgi:hypothetical protein